MSKKKYYDYRPEIVGMEWTPGNLILVASRSWGGKSQYVLGNCIVAGTKEEIPVAYFLPDGGTKERELNSALRILKAMAEALGIVIIVKSSLSDYNFPQSELPTIRDILDVTEAKSLCDQIILFHPVDILEDFYKMILPFGHPFFKDDEREMVLNLVLDKELGYFKKAESLYREVDPQALETPMYEWYRDTKYDDWYFEFLDSKGIEWKIAISPSVESENNEYDIDADNWAGDHINIAMEEPGEDMEKLKAFALSEARRRFPEADIPET